MSEVEASVLGVPEGGEGMTPEQRPTSAQLAAEALDDARITARWLPATESLRAVWADGAQASLRWLLAEHDRMSVELTQARSEVFQLRNAELRCSGCGTLLESVLCGWCTE